MKQIKGLKLDELLCIYHSLEMELQRLSISCMPDSMRNYWNQLTKIETYMRSLIIEEEKNNNAIIK